MLLDQQASVWRRVWDGAEYSDTQIVASVMVGIVPISTLDAVVPYARESTHVVWVPYWLALRKEDALKIGRRSPDAQGDILANIYTINGRQRVLLGMNRHTYYAREQD